ncbi:hypothetical protein ACTHGU_06665 [Chitinophagaceae bacterium MMS25-I14]
METIIDINPLKLYLPDGDRKSFLIRGDLKPITKVTWQGDAVKKVRKVIKELNLKPQPRIIYEESYTAIQSKSSEVTISVLRKLIELINSSNAEAITEEKVENIVENIRSWIIPERQRWKVGDVFSLKVQDNTFVFEQVIGEYPTIALFDMKKSEESIIDDELEKSDLITILHCTPDRLNNSTWKILANLKLLGNKDSGPTGSDMLRIGHKSYSSSILDSICNYYWFNLCDWEKEDDLKGLLLAHKKH